MPTVLVVEDEPDILELIRLDLSLCGYTVLTAPDGETGLELAQTRQPDVIVLDLMLPGIDGWEVLRGLKDAGGAPASIPVVVLTARVAEMDRVRGGIEGAVRYLTKPFDPSALEDTLEEVLAGEPEAAQRRAAQQQALHDLARIEACRPSGPEQPRPRLSRLEGPSAARRVPPPPPVITLAVLSATQRRLLGAVGDASTVSDAAEELAVSRSNVYSGLRRIARKLGVRSVPELISLARNGGLATD